MSTIFILKSWKVFKNNSKNQKLTTETGLYLENDNLM